MQTLGTPLAIEMLLHFYCTSEPFLRQNAPACMETLRMLADSGLVKPDDREGRAMEGAFQTTERGASLVAMLCRTPLPISLWVDPRTGKVVDL